MISLLRILFNDEPGSTKSKIIAIYTLLLVANLGAWAWALAAFHRYPVLLGTAFLAYSFGLRHAVDADHIAAIDNDLGPGTSVLLELRDLLGGDIVDQAQVNEIEFYFGVETVAQSGPNILGG